MLYHPDSPLWPWGQGHKLWNITLKFLVKVFFYFSVADSWSDFGQPCDIDLDIKWRSAWPIFHSPVILPYILKTIWCMNIILWDYKPVWPDVWPQNKCRSLWPILYGPVILPYILKTVWCINIIYFGIIICLCWGLTFQSTIFQSCRDGAIASWVINQYFRGVKCLAQGHNTAAAVGFKSPTSRSGVRHSTTEPPRSPLG